MSHTPGPWKVHQDADDPAPSRIVRDSGRGVRGESICAPIWSEKEPEEIRANANLIASAPELLELLMVARLWVSNGCVMEDGRRWHEVADDVLRRIEPGVPS